MLEMILPALLENPEEDSVMFGPMHIHHVSTKTTHTLSVTCLNRLPSRNEIDIVTHALKVLDFQQVVERWNKSEVVLEVTRWVQPELL